MKIKSMFKLIQGHQITDEELYQHIGEVPVLTGRNDIKGHWHKPLVNAEDLPCITYPTKGNAGNVYVQNEVFDANNTAVLIPYSEWRDKINLEWFSFKLPSIFLQIQTSKRGVSYLNKEIVEEQDMKIPEKHIQLMELDYYKKLKRLKVQLESIKSEINKIKEKNIIIDDKPSDEIKLSKIMDYVSRNDCLSEEGLYLRCQETIKSNKQITVISGSVNGVYGYIHFDKSVHFVDNRPCLQVVTRGNAGQLRFLPYGHYATNTNAMLLVVRESMKEALDIHNLNEEENYLKFLEVYLHPHFTEYCSSPDLSVLPLTKAIDDIKIPYFKYNEKIRSIVNKFKKIEAYENKIDEMLKRISLLFEKEILLNPSKK